MTKVQNEIDDAVSAADSTSSSSSNSSSCISTTGPIAFLLLCNVSEDKLVAQAAATFMTNMGKTKAANKTICLMQLLIMLVLD